MIDWTWIISSIIAIGLILTASKIYNTGLRDGFDSAVGKENNNHSLKKIILYSFLWICCKINVRLLLSIKTSTKDGKFCLDIRIRKWVSKILNLK